MRRRLGLAGSVNRASYQASQAVATCCTAATSAAATSRAPDRTAIAGWRAGGTPPRAGAHRARGRPCVCSEAQRCRRRRLPRLRASGGCSAYLARNAGRYFFAVAIELEHAQEVQAGVDGQREHARVASRWRDACAGARPASRAARCVGIVEPVTATFAADSSPEVAARERRGGRAHARLHRRAGVLALELADLPLARQHPQRIEQPGVGARADVGVRDLRLESRPAGDRRRGRHARRPSWTARRRSIGHGVPQYCQGLCGSSTRR